MIAAKNTKKLIGLVGLVVIAAAITWTLAGTDAGSPEAGRLEMPTQETGSGADQSTVDMPEADADHDAQTGTIASDKALSHEAYLAQWKNSEMADWQQRLEVLNQEEKQARLVERANKSALSAAETQRLREIILESAALSFLQAEYQLDALERKLDSP